MDLANCTREEFQEYLDSVSKQAGLQSSFVKPIRVEEEEVVINKTTAVGPTEVPVIRNIKPKRVSLFGTQEKQENETVWTEEPVDVHRDPISAFPPAVEEPVDIPAPEDADIVVKAEPKKKGDGYVSLPIRVKPEQVDEWKAFAASKGKSLRGFVISQIESAIKAEPAEPAVASEPTVAKVKDPIQDVKDAYDHTHHVMKRESTKKKRSWFWSKKEDK